MKKNIVLLSLAIACLSGCTADKEENFNIDQKAVKASVLNAVEQENEVLASCSTELGTGDDRIHNMKQASVSIDKYRLEPGEEFSFNKTLVATTAEYGYKKAIIFSNGKKIMSYGGGVCQVSSTLYNAALDAGLSITERHAHSMKVYYVPEGRDAATNMGSKDLKFKNDFDFPVEINTYMTEDAFVAEIIKIS